MPMDSNAFQRNIQIGTGSFPTGALNTNTSFSLESSAPKQRSKPKYVDQGYRQNESTAPEQSFSVMQTDI